MFNMGEFAFVINLRFISSTNFMFSSGEHEKSFITLGPGQTPHNGMFDQGLHLSQYF